MVVSWILDVSGAVLEGWLQASLDSSQDDARTQYSRRGRLALRLWSDTDPLLGIILVGSQSIVCLWVHICFSISDLYHHDLTPAHLCPCWLVEQLVRGSPPFSQRGWLNRTDWKSSIPPAAHGKTSLLLQPLDGDPSTSLPSIFNIYAFGILHIALLQPSNHTHLGDLVRLPSPFAILARYSLPCINNFCVLGWRSRTPSVVGDPILVGSIHLIRSETK